MTDTTWLCRDLAKITDPGLKVAAGAIVSGLITLIDLELSLAEERPTLASRTLTRPQQAKMAALMERFGERHPDAPVVDAVRVAVAEMRDSVLPRRKSTTH